MYKILIVFLILNFSNLAFSSTKEKIISKIQFTKNYTFNFIQTTDDKTESGSCTIKYPKKIFCKYKNLNKKIMVSNGKSLVIKNINKGSYYIYPLNKTPLELLLDKEYLISKIQNLTPRNIDDRFINFTISEDANKINIFFDKEDFNLIGWQTLDMYQNLTITFISSIKINKEINNKIFILPKNN